MYTPSIARDSPPCVRRWAAGKATGPVTSDGARMQEALRYLGDTFTSVTWTPEEIAQLHRHVLLVAKVGRHCCLPWSHTLQTCHG